MTTPSTFKDVNDPSFIADGEYVDDGDRFFGGTKGDLPRSRTRLALLQGTPGVSLFSVDPTTGAVTLQSAVLPAAGTVAVGPTTLINQSQVKAASLSAATPSATVLTAAATGGNYGLQVDTSAALAVTGLKVTSAAAGAGLALAAISSGTNENLTLDAKGTGTLTLAGVSTGLVQVPQGSKTIGDTSSGPVDGLFCAGDLRATFSSFSQQFFPGSVLNGTLKTTGLPGQAAVFGFAYDNNATQYPLGVGPVAGVGSVAVAGSAAYEDTHGAGNMTGGCSFLGGLGGTNIAGDIACGGWVQAGIGGNGMLSNGRAAALIGLYVWPNYNNRGGGNSSVAKSVGVNIMDQTNGDPRGGSTVPTSDTLNSGLLIENHVNAVLGSTSCFALLVQGGQSVFQGPLVATVTSTSSLHLATQFTLNAGYTGTAGAWAIQAVNNVAGTGTGVVDTSGNFGVYSSSQATTTGTNVGTWGNAQGGNINFGAVGQSVTNKNSATNCGVLGFASNTGTTPVVCGGFFGVRSTQSLPTIVSCALGADNGPTSFPVALFQAAGTTKVQVDNAGLLGFPNAASGAGALTGTLTNAPATGNPQFWVPITVNGTAYWLPAWHV